MLGENNSNGPGDGPDSSGEITENGHLFCVERGIEEVVVTQAGEVGSDTMSMELERNILLKVVALVGPIAAMVMEVPPFPSSSLLRILLLLLVTVGVAVGTRLGAAVGAVGVVKTVVEAMVRAMVGAVVGVMVGVVIGQNTKCPVALAFG